jgi:hypothetical protein
MVHVDDAPTHPEQFAFEIYFLAMGANWAQQLLDDRQGMSKARNNILEQIRSVATPNCPSVKMAKPV